MSHTAALTITSADPTPQIGQATEQDVIEALNGLTGKLNLFTLAASTLLQTLTQMAQSIAKSMTSQAWRACDKMKDAFKSQIAVSITVGVLSTFMAAGAGAYSGMSAPSVGGAAQMG